MSSSFSPPKIYHERNVRQLCAKHALNNLFQGEDYTKAQLDDICRSLSPDTWINPHRSLFALGNYDVNVIMKACADRNCEVVWFDRRKDPDCIATDQIVGFILNVPNRYEFGWIAVPAFGRRHWISVRKIGGVWLNLDSKLQAPVEIGGDVELIAYLRKQLADNDKEVLIVVEQDRKWLK